MFINFNFPELKHPNSKNLSIKEVATVLEGKYHVIENFIEKIEIKLNKHIKNMYDRKKTLHIKSLEEWLKNEWREYVLTGQAGFTAASQKRGDPAFIDTSSYYLGCQPVFVLTKKEKEKYIRD